MTERSKNAKVVKRFYSSPKLKNYGSINELTRKNGSSQVHDAGNSAHRLPSF